MKLRYLILLLLVVLFQRNNSSAQLVTDNAFLGGKWLQVGIAPNGSWGNTVPVPAGYTTRGGSSLSYTDPITGTVASGNGLDFSFDQGHDGWTVGTPPWYGAFFLPGTPFDGWQIEIDDTMASAFYSSGGFDTAEGGNFGGTVVSWSGPTCWNPQAPNAGTWAGTYGLRRPWLRNALRITQINEVDSFASWCNVTTKFVNTSDSIMRGVYYMASGDPDNDEDLPGGSFPTDNHISYQGGPLDRHEVNARPNPGSHPLAFSGLATQDCRAKVLIYQSWPPTIVPGNNLNRVWAGTTSSMGGVYYTLGYTTTSQDIAYGVIFNVGDLAPHDSAFISYAWIFSDTTAVDSIFKLSPQLSTVGTVHSAGTRDSVFGCDLTGCNTSGLTFVADIINGDSRNWSYSSWSWSPAIGLSSVAGTRVTVDIGALTSATTYTITGTPSATRGSCTPPAPVTFYLFVQPCFYATNNSPICVYDTLKLFAHGDSTGATYFWYGPAGYTASTQNAIRTGMTMADTGWYTVVRTTGSAHDTAVTYVVLKPKPVVIATSNSPVCSGAPNTLTLNVSPDSVGETYRWSGPLGFTSTLVSPSVVSPPVTAGGVYKVVATFNGCKDSATVNAVVDSTPAIPTIGSNAPICSHRDRLLLTSSDATAGVSYYWTGPLAFASILQNPVINPDVPVGASGVYTVTASLGICKSSSTLAVVVDKTPDLPVLSTNAPICSGNELDLFAASDGGSSYKWNGPNSFTSLISNPIINPAYTPATGVYSVTATIVYPGIPAGCVSDTATMFVIVDSTVTSGFKANIRYGCKADTVAFTNTSLEADHFKWVFGDYATSLAKDPVHIYATQGVYTVTLVSMKGVCRATSDTVLDLVHPLHAAFTSDTNLVCQGTIVTFTDASVATTKLGIAPSYAWYFGDGGTSGIQSPGGHLYQRAGVYNAFEVVSNFVPCHDTAYKVIAVDSISPIRINLTDSAGLCTEDHETFTGIFTDIGNTGVVWDFGDGDSILNMNPVKYAYSKRGTFILTATALYRVCPTISTTRNIYVGPQPHLYLGTDTTICKGSSALKLADRQNEGDPTASWLWSTGETKSFIIVTAPGTYYARVRIGGCGATDTIVVKNDCYMTIPNVFTPNGDGMNDYFFPRQFLTSGLTSFSMNIYNRWGQVVFQTTSLDGMGWDGKFNDVPQPSGVFVYIIEATFKDGQKEHHQGNVTLLR
jgi:gliding motility-associated-like protein